jgi:hypothetical protein
MVAHADAADGQHEIRPRERIAKGGKPSGPPAPTPKDEPNPLAAIAAAQRPPVPLKVLESSGTLQDVTITVTAAEMSQTVAGPKTSVSTEDRFLRVAFTATAKKDSTLELSTVKLVNGAQEAEVARDVQRVGQGSSLSTTALKANEPVNLVLYFEAPPTLLNPGRAMVLTQGEAKLSLQLQ